MVRSWKENIFGGFADCEWTSRDLTVRDGQKKSFIFTVRDNKSVIKLSMKEGGKVEIQDNSFCGPTFGYGDLIIENNCDTKKSYAETNSYEKDPDHAYLDQGEDAYFLVSEIEVFRIIN